MNDDELLNHLLGEIQETLSDFEQRCLRLEGTFSPAEMKAIFRAAHNIKGGGYLFGMNEFGAFVHTVEEMLGALIELGQPVTEETVDILLAWHQAVVEWVEALRQDSKTVKDYASIRERILAHTKSIRATPTDTPPVEAEVVAAAAPPASTASTAAEPVAQVVQPAPPAPGVPIDLTNDPLLAGLMDPTPPAAGPAPTGAVSASAAEESAKATEKFNVSELRRKQAVGSLRIPSAKVDDIMQIIGELSIHQSILMHGQVNGTSDSDICRNSVMLNQKALRNLHELVLRLRMQPIESLFQRVERTARDLARQQGKKISITVLGSETLLDKTVIEMMVDPLVHLIRNAVDHGIENEETRTAAGKSAQANVVLEAQQDAGLVTISMTDDGKGMDPAVIEAKAISKGLIPEVHNLKESEILQLIYVPGFSTRDVADAISGRGVGMDVVKEGVQRLGGRIDLATKKGVGTSFQIALPTSLEIIDGLVVRLGSEVYIAPMQDVVEIVDLGMMGIEKFGVAGWATRLRDLVVPVEDLGNYLFTTRKPAATKTPIVDSEDDDERNVGLIIRLDNGNRLALRVNQVLSQQQVVVRPLSEQLSKVPGFTGVTILGNGEPTLILNILSIAESYVRWTGQRRRAS